MGVVQRRPHISQLNARIKTFSALFRGAVLRVATYGTGPQFGLLANELVPRN